MKRRAGDTARWSMGAAAMAVAVSAMLSGCNTSGCTDNQSALPLAGFYSAESKAAVTLNNFEIAGVGAPRDSVLYATGVGRSEVYLPFRSTTGETSYEMTYRPNAETVVKDMITFRYTSEPYFASEECGAMYYYRITKVEHTSNLIDSIGVTDSLITNANVQQIKIFLHGSQRQ